MAAIAAGLVAVALGATGAAAASDLMPGVTYERKVERIRGRPVVVHVVQAPRPTGLYRLAPVLSGGTVLGRATVTSMQRALSDGATSVGINADYFSFVDGHPSGMLLNDGVLKARPVAARSSLAITRSGELRVARIGFYGSFALGDGPRGKLDQFNRPLAKGEVGLFSPAYGPATPRGHQTVDVLVESVAALPNTDLQATVVSVGRGGGTPIPPTGAVLQARGAAAARMLRAAQVGAPFAARLILRPWWDDVVDAVGGGPALVRAGRAVSPFSEAFTTRQLAARAPATAVGQRPDGQLLLVAVDGRSRQSAGVTMRDLAAELDRLGAVTAIAFDGGGSTTLAFEGRVLNRPSDGRERPVGDALFLLYYGVYVPPPAHSVVSPNGDGVAERQRLRWKLVRPSTVDIRLLGPGGRVAWKLEEHERPGLRSVPAAALARLAEGRWRLVVHAVDDDGRRSTDSRAFTVNETLGYLSLAPRTLVLAPRRRAALEVRFRLAHRAAVRVDVARAGGPRVRTLLAATRPAGAVALAWNGRGRGGHLVPSGRYVVRVTASNRLGTVQLVGSISVERRHRR